jgi:hypothetical protein
VTASQFRSGHAVPGTRSKLDIDLAEQLNALDHERTDGTSESRSLVPAVREAILWGVVGATAWVAVAWIAS